MSIATTALDLTMFAACLTVLRGSWPLVAARWTCSAIGALANFALNRTFAFQTSARASTQLTRYALVALAAITLATLIWHLLHALTPFDARLLHPISAAIVWLAFTYPLLERWVFPLGANRTVVDRDPLV